MLLPGGLFFMDTWWRNNNNNIRSNKNVSTFIILFVYTAYFWTQICSLVLFSKSLVGAAASLHPITTISHGNHVELEESRLKDNNKSLYNTENDDINKYFYQLYVRRMISLFYAIGWITQIMFLNLFG